MSKFKRNKPDSVPKVEPKVEQNEGISLNEYLAKFHGQRVLDNIIKKWYRKQDSSNPKRPREDWDKIILNFHNKLNFRKI